jgi:hypothetical protein
LAWSFLFEVGPRRCRAAWTRVQHTARAACPRAPRCAHFLCHAFGPLSFHCHVHKLAGRLGLIPGCTQHSVKRTMCASRSPPRLSNLIHCVMTHSVTCCASANGGRSRTLLLVLIRSRLAIVLPRLSVCFPFHVYIQLATFTRLSIGQAFYQWPGRLIVLMMSGLFLSVSS